MTTEPSPTARRPMIVWDLVLTIVLLLLGAVVAATFAFFGVFIAFMSDSCGSAVACNIDAISTGMMVAIGAPIVAFLAAAIVAVVRLVRRRVAFWVAIAGIVASALGWGLGVAIAGSGVPGFFG